jgi:hypothetical protein
MSFISVRQEKDKMNALLKILPQNLPVFIRKEVISELFRITADAFECPTPKLGHLSLDASLMAYAQFTKEQAETTLQSKEDAEAIKTRLYQIAYALGTKLRKWVSIDTMEEVMHLGQILYRAIGIEIEGNSQGDLIVKRCNFSQFYSGPVCDLISAMDDGIFSGLSGGGRLVFSERLTEGRECCRAKLNLRGNGD